MGTEPLERKLAAILYADVAGYSRLTGEDEEGTQLWRADFVAVNRIGRWSFFSQKETGLSEYQSWMHDNL
jgi:hypothetical protein